MTQEEVIELYIRAAEVDRRLPDTARPARLKAQSLPYVHDHVDQAGWGGQRYEEERLAFWEARSTRLQLQDVSTWERANDLIVLVERERDRRCLWAYAKSKAGGTPFSRWCRNVEHIHRNYGKECADRASSQISLSLALNGMINQRNAENGTLHDRPEIEHISVNIEELSPRSWMAPGAFSAVADLEARDFSWSEMQNARRREREARKRQAA